jgi:hypothetical protein
MARRRRIGASAVAQGQARSLLPAVPPPERARWHAGTVRHRRRFRPASAASSEGDSHARQPKPQRRPPSSKAICASDAFRCRPRRQRRQPEPRRVVQNRRACEVVGKEPRHVGHRWPYPPPVHGHDQNAARLAARTRRHRQATGTERNRPPDAAAPARPSPAGCAPAPPSHAGADAPRASAGPEIAEARRPEPRPARRVRPQHAAAVARPDPRRVTGGQQCAASGKAANSRMASRQEFIGWTWLPSPLVNKALWQR